VQDVARRHRQLLLVLGLPRPATHSPNAGGISSSVSFAWCRRYSVPRGQTAPGPPGRWRRPCAVAAAAAARRRPWFQLLLAPVRIGVDRRSVATVCSARAVHQHGQIAFCRCSTSFGGARRRWPRSWARFGMPVARTGTGWPCPTPLTAIRPYRAPRSTLSAPVSAAACAPCVCGPMGLRARPPVGPRARRAVRIRRRRARSMGRVTTEGAVSAAAPAVASVVPIKVAPTQ